MRLIVGTRRRVLIAIDWTKLRRWPVLVAGIVHRGRAIPVLWSVADPAKLYKSQNAFEHVFFAWLRASLPPNVEAVVLLDRGFKRVDIVAHLKGLRFVIRTGGNVHVRSKEPWILMTDLTDPALRIFALYALRFRIEESFRDQKDWRYGLQAGHTLVRSPARLERMLLIASIVLFFAILIGAKARQDRLDKGFRANTVTHKPTHSDFALGIFYAMKFRCTRSVLLRIFYREGRDVFGG